MANVITTYQPTYPPIYLFTYYNLFTYPPNYLLYRPTYLYLFTHPATYLRIS
jgi:hypothetical protein